MARTDPLPGLWKRHHGHVGRHPYQIGRPVPTEVAIANDNMVPKADRRTSIQKHSLTGADNGNTTDNNARTEGHKHSPKSKLNQVSLLLNSSWTHSSLEGSIAGSHRNRVTAQGFGFISSCLVSSAILHKPSVASNPTPGRIERGEIRSNHSMGPGPFSCRLDSSFLVLLPPLCNVIRQRVVRIWCS